MTYAYATALARAYEFYDYEDLASDLVLLAWKLGKKGEKNEGWIRQKCRYYAMDYRRRKALERAVFAPLDAASGKGKYENATLDFLLWILAGIAETPSLQLLAHGHTVRDAAKILRRSKSSISREIISLRRGLTRAA